MDYNYGTPTASSTSSTSAPYELLTDFEPLMRARSNTWPCRPVELDPGATTNNNQQQQQQTQSPPCYTSASASASASGGGGNHENSETLGILLQKKSTSRRNAWGNLSYADLITQAISSSPEKRLTLSQIYDWMVTNVTYFKDKGDSNSSAGWKNSIRHNLSLHNRFVRVQNEGTGKSSWWMLNPDAKPGKAARRRATSMETSKYEKKRGRIRKKIEAMRNGGVLGSPSPCSSLSEGLDLFPEETLSHLHHTHSSSPSTNHTPLSLSTLLSSPQPSLSSTSTFQLSPNGGDFRPRASSNASSVGRLSPILNVNEVDVQGGGGGGDGGQWDYYNNSCYNNQAADQLAGNLANMVKIGGGDHFYFGVGHGGEEQRVNFFTTSPANISLPLLLPPQNHSPSSSTPHQQLFDQKHSPRPLQQSSSLNPQQPHPQEEADFTFDQLSTFCDVDEVLQNDLMQHNLALDGGEFFQVDSIHGANGGGVVGQASPQYTTTTQQQLTQQQQQQQQSNNPRQWVH